MSKGAHAKPRPSVKQKTRMSERTAKKSRKARKEKWLDARRNQKQREKAEKKRAKEERRLERKEQRAYKRSGKEPISVSRGPSEVNDPVFSEHLRPEKRKPKPAAKAKTPKKPKLKPISAQDSIPFLGMAPDGTALVTKGTYARCMSFGDMDYKLARREDREAIFERWCEMLNSLDESVSVDLTCISRKPEPGELAEVGDVSPKGDFLDPVRADYADMMASRAAAASGGMVKEHYLTFATTAKDAREARSRLATVENSFATGLRSLHVKCHMLTRSEYVRLISRQCKGRSPEAWQLDRGYLADHSVKDIVCPVEYDFGHADWYRVDGTYKRGSFLQITAPEITDEILANFMACEKPCTVSIHLQPVGQLEGKKLASAKQSDIDKMKIDEQKKAIRAGYDPDILPPALVTFEAEAKRLVKMLEDDNERVFDSCITAIVEGRNLRELDDAFFALDAIAQSHNCKLRKLSYLQEQAFAASLPLGVRRLPIERTLITRSAAAFMPFTAAELSTGGEALCYGVNAVTRNLICADRKLLKNPNGLILGVPGGGKSFAAKGEIVGTILLTDDDVIVCDPEAEYAPVVNACGGQVVKISSTSRQHINPMDINLDYSDDDNPLSLKSDFILSVIEVIMGGHAGLTAAEKSVIDRCLPRIYQPYLDDPNPQNMPILGDLHAALLEQSEPEAAGIATALEIYVNGSLSVFNHRTDVELSNRIVCFDVKDLGKQLKRLGMLVVQDQVWNRVTANRAAKRSTRYFVDEFHLLLRDEQTSAYMVEIWKRFRKWGGLPMGITQNVKDLLSSREIESILDNTEFIMMLSQASGDRTLLAKHLAISDQQLGYITNAESGCGLLFYGDVIVPFENRYDPDTRLYRLLTTKPGEGDI